MTTHKKQQHSGTSETQTLIYLIIYVDRSKGGNKLEKFKQNPIVKKVGFNRIVLLGVLILMYVVFCIAVTGFA